MSISNNCVNIVKEFEGFRSKPYKCSAGIPTIGYGSTFYINDEELPEPYTLNRMFERLTIEDK